jgi:dTMP kinase
VHSGTPGGGRFITFEGPDGAGKSEQARRLATRLGEAGIPVVLTREPGGTPLGERIRALILDATLDRSPDAEALLFNGARAELLAEVIRPALTRGESVVCDRYADSTLAYQGYGAGADLGRLRAIQLLVTGGIVPDVTILLDVAASTGLARRAEGAAEELTRFETGQGHDAAFHERVRQGFLALAAEEPERWRLVDGDGTPDAVQARVLAALDRDAPDANEPSAPMARIGT